MRRIDLYKKDKKGKIRRWSIWQDENFLCTESGLIDGEMIENSEQIPFGIGGRDKQEQMNMRIKSRMNKKIDSGYSTSLENVKMGTDRLNLLGFDRPMTAERLACVEDTPQELLWLQYKYNGHRCMIVKTLSGKVLAYSKIGKLIRTIPEILDEFDDLPIGTILDGELYHHGTPLQTIGSWVKRRQKNTQKLSFVCYDVVMKKTFRKRLKFLKNVFQKETNFGNKSKLAETVRVKKNLSVLPILRSALNEGYEGLMIRLDTLPYESGVRSTQILKVKRKIDKGFIMDDEFLVTKITASKDGWAILHCETDKGVRFRISAPGDVEEKTMYYLEKEKYIGKHIRAEFEGYTVDKKPVEAVALMFREKHEE